MSVAMQLNRPFLKLPIRFDADALAAEVRALPASAWSPHPTGFAGNDAVRLVSPGGQATDAVHGEMKPTPALNACAYIREVMATIGAVWGRSRLMGLGAGKEVPAHIDTNYYWRTHIRIHIPVVTNPGVLFTCGDETVHMAAGECWVFDSFQWHNVQNSGAEQRIHLVLDTVGGGRLHQLMQLAEAGSTEGRLVRPGEVGSENLLFEKMNSPTVMSPWEMRCHLAFLRAEAQPHPLLPKVADRMEQFVEDWAAAWAAYGTHDSGHETYSRLIQTARGDVLAIAGKQIVLKNKWPLSGMFDQLIFVPALRSRQAPIPYPLAQPGGSSRSVAGH